MTNIDWIIVICFLFILFSVAIYTSTYMKSVASFLSANRCAGRYLLAVATGMSALGAISIVANYEMYFKAGFIPKWWEMIYVPIALLVSISGWVVYRFRQTRAMTLAQFFEIRYSRRFRILAGIMASVSGILNFGIFPSVGARFFLYFWDLPNEISILGLPISTYALLMIILLGISLAFAFLGGQITVIVTDFIQGSFFNLASVVIIVYLLFVYFDWGQISEALMSAPVKESKVNPFSTSGEKDFNMWFFLIQAFYMFYATMGWQGSQAYQSSGISAHEQKMASVISRWRTYVLMLLMVVVPICTYCIMNHSNFTEQAQMVNQLLDRISLDTGDTIRKQMTVPIAMKTILPPGLLGLMCTIMLAAFISTHDTYLHSWAVILIQDVVMPFRSKPFTPKQHMFILRFAILGVAVFAFFFSYYFRQTDYILMFFAVVGAIFLGGVGAVTIGGLYWKKGSTAAAYTSMTIGAVIAMTGIVMQQVFKSIGKEFPINGQIVFFLSMVSAGISYVIVSLFSKTNHNMDKLLNRGSYAVAEDLQQEAKVTGNFFKDLWSKMVTNEFCRSDKILYSLTIIWGLGWFVIFILGCVANLIFNIPDDIWMSFWKYWLFILFGVSIIIIIWLIVGGTKNLFEMFSSLRSRRVNDADDGWVEKIDD